MNLVWWGQSGTQLSRQASSLRRTCLVSRTVQTCHSPPRMDDCESQAHMAAKEPTMQGPKRLCTPTLIMSFHQSGQLGNKSPLIVIGTVQHGPNRSLSGNFNRTVGDRQFDCSHEVERLARFH